MPLLPNRNFKYYLRGSEELNQIAVHYAEPDENGEYDPLDIQVFKSEQGNMIIDVALALGGPSFSFATGGPSVTVRYETSDQRAIMTVNTWIDSMSVELDPTSPLYQYCVLIFENNC